MSNYVTLTVDGCDNYIRRDKLAAISEVDTVIFDCDGVLIDVTDAYGKAVGETVSYICNLLLGIPIPENTIDNDVIFAFKKTGGFNNDWALTYAVLMYILNSLPPEEYRIVEGIVEESMTYDTLESRMRYVISSREQLKINTSHSLREKLLVFAGKLDETGNVLVDTLLGNVSGPVRSFLGFPGEVGQALIPTVFELLFDGSDLFEDTFEMKPLLRKEKGLVDEGRVIIKSETLAETSKIIGTENYGIASGSIQNTAKHVLGPVKELFKEGAQVWMDDVLFYMRGQPDINLHKPDPFSLVKAAEGFEPFKKVLYVGDTMADLFTVRNTQKVDQRYLFMGVYQHGFPGDDMVSLFIENDAAIVAANVNMLPQILMYVRNSS